MSRQILHTDLDPSLRGLQGLGNEFARLAEHLGRLGAALRGGHLGNSDEDETPLPAAVRQGKWKSAPGSDLALPPWIYPPANYENIDKSAYIQLPAIGVESVVLQFQVPPGRNGVINKIANVYVGGGFVEGSGDIAWRISLEEGGTSQFFVDGYENILGSLGPMDSPTQTAGFRIYEGQVVSVTVANVSIPPAQQPIGARLMGWFYPRAYDDENVWI